MDGIEQPKVVTWRTTSFAEQFQLEGKTLPPIPHDPKLWPVPEGLHERDPRYLMNCLTAVGPDKALGDMTAERLVWAGACIESLLSDLVQNGNRYILFPHNPIGQPGIQDTWIFAWNETALSSLIQEHEKIVSEYGFPLDTEKFVRRVKEEPIPLEEPLHRVIALAFNNPERIKLYDEQNTVG
jgi:hypothetical protein